MSFAKRELAIVDGTGRHRVAIHVFAPEQGERGWMCRYEIGWPERQRSGAGYGIDGMQALTIALQNIGAELYASPYHTAGTLVFDKPGNGYGFPIAKDARHLLVGDDARHEGNG
ncbi:hypothetical protein [Devosia sp. FKR38]|uniref:DUF6968 family protein n=1 Tax=Devosia sp. FKR38 TaxID=2562312 RepID=UPI0010BF81F3|nr:hypothetical protein [Devosia sp. FKR38]